MLSKNKWYKYIILSSLCYAMVDNFGKSFCSCHCCDKDDSGDDFWSRMPVNLLKHNLFDGCYALLSYERGDSNYLIDCDSKLIFYLPSNVKKNTVEPVWKPLQKDLDTTQTEIIYYHGGFGDLQSIENIMTRLFGVLGKEKLGKVSCLVDKNGTVVLRFNVLLVMFKDKKGFVVARQGHDLEELFSRGDSTFCKKCEHFIHFKIKKYNGSEDATVSVCVACGNFVSTVQNFTKMQFGWFLGLFNSDISDKKKRFELFYTKKACPSIDDYEKIDLAGYKYLKFLKEGVSVNNVIYPDTVLLWGKQLYKILAEKWKL